MTHDQLVAALAKDQETTRTKIEDILLALRDLCLEEILNGRNFVFPGVGTLGRRKENNAPRFDIVPELRKKLGLRDRIEGEICRTCKKKPRQTRKRECSGCRARAYRAKKNPMQAA